MTSLEATSLEDNLLGLLPFGQVGVKRKVTCPEGHSTCPR